MAYYPFVVLFFFAAFFQGCGRKQRTIFLFPEDGEVRLSTLQFTAPKIVSVQSTQLGIEVNWLPPVLMADESHGKLLGYNLYRLTQRGCIPKKPLNHEPITSQTFHEKQVTQGNRPRYIVRAIFELKSKTHEGPASNIGVVNKKSAE